MKLSFVIPAYNVEKYLSKCLDSILKQELLEKEYEIILIDDGSTDGTLDICMQYKKRYNNIKVFQEKNGGVSRARNIGLAAAEGDYVCFLDGDDFYSQKFAGKFLEMCYMYNLDILRGWYGIFDEETKEYSDHSFPNISYANQAISGREFLVKSIQEHVVEVVPWLGFFRREYLYQNKINFPEGISYEEDHVFFLKTLLVSPDCKAFQSDIDFYAYRKRAGSATKTPSLKQAKDVMAVVELEKHLVEEMELEAYIRKAALRYISASFYQLTSIYGRLTKKDATECAKLVPFYMKWQCLHYSYDRHQQIKICLFTFARCLVDLVYRLKKIKN